MIAYVKGNLVEVSEDNLVVDVNGIGYNIRVSASTVQKMPPIGEEVKIYTYTMVREDAFLLYGFLSRNDLNIFKQCISVNGIGPKAALSVLSVMDADTLRFAILSGDVKAICRAPGIGSKTAERLILDLKDKITMPDLSGEGDVADDSGSGFPDSSEFSSRREAIDALVALGYGQTESVRAVKQVKNASELDSGGILKAALKNLF